MAFNPELSGIPLSGSMVRFKKLERPALSEGEKDLKLENERELQKGIRILRQLRTRALEEETPDARQEILRTAHRLSEQMAEEVMNQSIGVKPTPIGSEFLEEVRELRNDYAETEEGSGHGLPASFTVGNLLKATDDMLARVEEKAGSIERPDHSLSAEEMRYVLREFLVGTNDLSSNAIETLFDRETKIGGILTGGSVYVEVVKNIVKRYGDASLSIGSFVIAVDKDGNRIAVEADESDSGVRNVILADDMIDGGGTMLTALWKCGERFPNAAIRSGLGTDSPGGFEKRRQQEHMTHLEGLFQDFADLSEEGMTPEAHALFDTAEKYARENDVELQPGWNKRKARLEQQEGGALQA